MSWKPLSKDDLKLSSILLKYIRTVRETNLRTHSLLYNEMWLPSEVDIIKSALFERLRSGLEPLSEPPPLGYSCPWYALIEDAGPHYIFDCYFNDDKINILQNMYEIVEKTEDFYIVKDASKNTSYRFKVFYDKEWEHPTAKILGSGGWFITLMEQEQ